MQKNIWHNLIFIYDKNSQKTRKRWGLSKPGEKFWVRIFTQEIPDFPKWRGQAAVWEVGVWVLRRGGGYRWTWPVTGQVGSHLGDKEDWKNKVQDQTLEEKEESAMERGTTENKRKRAEHLEGQERRCFKKKRLVSHIVRHCWEDKRLLHVGSWKLLVIWTWQVLENG